MVVVVTFYIVCSAIYGVHLSLLLGCMSTVAFGMIAPWPLAGTALLSLLLPVMLCLVGSVTYHTPHGQPLELQNIHHHRCKL